MAAHKNRQIWLKPRPNGISRARDFALREAGIPAPAEIRELLGLKGGDNVAF